MPKTPSDIMKAMIGEYVAMIAILQSQIESLQEQNDMLQKSLAGEPKSSSQSNQ